MEQHLDHDKSRQLLGFLHDLAEMRCRRQVRYSSSSDTLLWFHTLPGACCDVRSILYEGASLDEPLWLEIRKRPQPSTPELPSILTGWVDDDLYDANSAPRLLSQRKLPDTAEGESADDPADSKEVHVERLDDHPEVREAWKAYLDSQWRPWQEAYQHWDAVQSAYKRLDVIRRELEKSDETFELVMAVGLLEGPNSKAENVQRHLLVAPAEIELEPAEGILRVIPAVEFDQFKLDLSMLPLNERPEFSAEEIEEPLAELGPEVGNSEEIGQILRIIANRLAPDSQVHPEAWEPPTNRTQKAYCVSFAPALILKRRTNRAYEDLVGRIREQVEKEPATVPPPWIVVTGGDDGGHRKPTEREPSPTALPANEPLHFPLPSNDQQRQIAETLQRRPYLLVKGPPGTGKSHTIANLISHLLATGQRVLVTAQSRKALTVLRDLIPEGMRDLCVTALGASREEKELLENTVRHMISESTSWDPQRASRQIVKLEQQLHECRQNIARMKRQLQEIREAETRSTERPGGYRGTAAAIAKKCRSQTKKYKWFPRISSDDLPCPLDDDALAFFADWHASLTAKRKDELAKNAAKLVLPATEQLRQWLTEEEGLSRQLHELAADSAGEETTLLQQVPDDGLSALRAALDELSGMHHEAEAVLGPLAAELVGNVMNGNESRWHPLTEKLNALASTLAENEAFLRDTQVDLPADTDILELIDLTRSRLRHFATGGKRRIFWFFTPRVLRETAVVEQECRVNGARPRDAQTLETLAWYLDLKRQIDSHLDEWPREYRVSEKSVNGAALELRRRQEPFVRLYNWCLKHRAQLGLLPPQQRATLFECETLDRWRLAVQAEQVRRRLDAVRHRINELGRSLEAATSANAHPSLQALREAISARNATLWEEAFEAYSAAVQRQKQLARYQGLRRTLESTLPALRPIFQKTEGQAKAKARIRHLNQAWYWRLALAWVRRVTDPQAYADTKLELERLQEEEQDLIKRLATKKAWAACVGRLDRYTQRNLQAWSNAMRRVGAGKGKYAFKHQRTARKYLRECLPKIPAWIMPVHKLWETVDALPGAFDTIIVDEASQAGLDSLLLFLLAKRIVVVGDDQQNSPEGIGVREDDITALVKKHLKGSHFADEFRPDSSLYDHALLAFGSPITLREHFRCVPEIIRFSNNLCYSDTPLIPLRQGPPERLPPLRAVFVPDGYCEGKDARLINRSEAERIADTIEQCINDPAYEGKTFGVITLQGHTQADLVEKMLIDRIEPRELEARRLRCGTSATFQGDQRDVIFLSMVVAPQHRFRALRQLADVRRFNVAMSRARDQVWLFHSVQLDDLQSDDLRARIYQHFYKTESCDDEAIYAQREELEKENHQCKNRSKHRPPKPYESWFEVDVALELLRRNYRVRPQWEVAGYRIDLVIECKMARLAVECDGDHWHGIERFQDDMHRQLQLERAGWRFVRVRESEFYVDRKRCMQAVVEALEQLEPQAAPDTPPHTGKPTATPTPPASLQAEDETEDSLSPHEDLPLLHAVKENKTAWQHPTSASSSQHDDQPGSRAAGNDAPTGTRPGKPESNEGNGKVPVSAIKPERTPPVGCVNRLRPQSAEQTATVDRKPPAYNNSNPFPENESTWKRLAHWAKQNDHFTPKERNFFYTVGHSFRPPGWMLTRKQRNWAESLWHQALQLGFDPEHND